MKIETYHAAYDQLTACAREASEIDQPEVLDMIEDARARLHQAWDRLIEIENGATVESPNDSPQP